MSTRADVALVERGLVRSRTLARRLIAAVPFLTDGTGRELPEPRTAQTINPDLPVLVLASRTSCSASAGYHDSDVYPPAAGTLRS